MALLAWSLCSRPSRKADVMRATIACCQYHVRERAFPYSSTRSPISPADVRGGINNSRSAVARAGGSVGFTLCLLKLPNAPPHFDEGAFGLTNLTNPVCRHTEMPFRSPSALRRRFAQAG